MGFSKSEQQNWLAWSLHKLYAIESVSDAPLESGLGMSIALRKKVVLSGGLLFMRFPVPAVDFFAVREFVSP